MQSKTKKTFAIISIILIIIIGLFFYIRFYFVFGEGVKAGELNYFVHKGYIFKTYEGKLIQSGFRSQGAGSILSNEFQFSVENKKVADSLMRCSGKEVELHYHEYFGTLPWRGINKFVVDSIVSVRLQ